MGTVTKQQKNVPELRFPAFSDEWSKEKFQNLVKINQGLQIAISERLTNPVDGSYFYITNEFLKVGSAKKYYIKNPPLSVTCIESDVLMTRTGNTGIVVTGVAGAFHNNFFKINYPADVLNKDFLVYYLRLPTTQRLILKLAGTSTIPDLNHSDFYRIELVKPKFEEQQKIADFLGSVDVWLNNLRQQKIALETYKRGMMQKLFTQKVRFKDEDGKDYPEWEQKRLGEIAKSVKGKGLSKDDIVKGGSHKCIRYAELYTNYGEVITDIASETNIGTTDMVLSKRGDLLFPSSGETAEDIARFSSLQEEGVILSGDLNAIRFSEDADSSFFAYYLTNHLNTEIAKFAQGNSVVHLYWSHFNKLSFEVPCFAEQQKIADFLIALDGSIKAKVSKITKTEQWKKGLMQKMFV